MFSEFLQYLFTGITIGATYALIALGFTLIYNASHVINFAQGEFLMIGGMATVSLTAMGVPMLLAIVLAVVLAGVLGIALQRLAIAPAKNADVVTLIIITIGASIFIRGLAQLVWGKEYHVMPNFSSEEPIQIFGAVLNSQSLWVLGVGAVLVAVLVYFFTRTLTGKAILATSMNKDAARLVGIRTQVVLMLAFMVSALLGSVAGIVVAPITFTSYDIGIILGLKGFVAAAIGGLGSGMGAVVGGLALGVVEAMAAGYLSSDYKDAVAFSMILVVLFFMPRGLFGAKVVERV
ncbi:MULTISPECIES: branched-chain amino acid ABC transporter permease [Marinobacter]|jgi:branched-chain amino acid transport system permease protein|uniref:Branched-chain amino acid ABC transporter permease n=1 Tax=Marinobacter salexigens TaxID=1925763 RepID=A0ABS6A4C7_9GAMM|nr:MULTISPECIES: branched-chain amino acid ABC transporter permease [Marinobacter]MBL1273287.1 branched-chain amino acid ABC transporter permease [Oceanospirillales bacterium]MBU2872589.1 branched-chain amino acid ABC transporter permease [Marinobacter salexigens]MDO6443359.1 branched-chain amino acid ABC transporter permease [Marinobacter sp. 2_MG-2023]MDO6824243.1 branched-chain amino acid ABC transporter permease [Marinobacter sp. 1_MG-2023]|tara:strand:- start:194 stop:1069 length:876 start_codon:yes stop_codon:yes gene_type:complete